MQNVCCNKLAADGATSGSISVNVSFMNHLVTPGAHPVPPTLGLDLQKARSISSTRAELQGITGCCAPHERRRAPFDTD